MCSIYLVIVSDEYFYIYLSKEKAERAAKIIKNTLASFEYIKYEDNLDCHGIEDSEEEISVKICEIKEGECLQNYYSYCEYPENNLCFDKLSE